MGESTPPRWLLCPRGPVTIPLSCAQGCFACSASKPVSQRLQEGQSGHVCLYSHILNDYVLFSALDVLENLQYKTETSKCLQDPRHFLPRQCLLFTSGSHPASQTRSSARMKLCSYICCHLQRIFHLFHSVIIWEGKHWEFLVDVARKPGKAPVQDFLAYRLNYHLGHAA